MTADGERRGRPAHGDDSPVDTDASGGRSSGSEASPPAGRRRRSPRPARQPQLFNELPSRTAEALATFAELEVCTYSNRSLGDSGQEEIMTCDCKAHTVAGVNTACDENSDCINRMTSMECVDDECNCGTACRNQRFQRREFAPVDVIQTEKKGFGLRATADIRQGTFIYEYIGEVVDEARFRRRMQQYDEQGVKHFYFMMLQKGEFVDATQRGCLARFCNHSCSPNCYVDKWVVRDKLRMGIFAKVDIVAGEEITFDYNVDRYGAQAQPCYCGEDNCIGFIGGKTQTEAASKLPQVFVDALGISDDEDWATTTKRKRKTKTDDEDYVATLPNRAAAEDGVSKIMSGLLQCKEKWLVSRLLKRIHMSDDQLVHRRVMRMHGYQILGNIVREWAAEDDVVILVLEILAKWPRMTRNKISSAKIEGTVQKFSHESKNDRVQELAAELVAEWQSLQLAYRIPRRERPVKVEEPERDDRADRAEREPASATPLPWGWASAEDPNGKTYYYNRAENKTQWEFPEVETASVPAPPPAPPAATPAPNVIDLQKIIEEANKQLAEKAEQAPKPAEPLPTTDPLLEPERRRSSGHRPKPDAKDVTPEMRLTKILAKYIPNVVSRYEKELGHDRVKKYSKEITKILVEKELRSGKDSAIKSELPDDKKKKIKAFVKTYMDKVVARKKEKATAGSA
ncbi:uncharacterized protein V1510DRAFT_365528 [Dipodascopsis tothii]|uniref:uncharacterized protein n=1 Tax=Dipodascopsis tothii TaxID=44089 RepID=UPI0034CD2D91